MHFNFERIIASGYRTQSGIVEQVHRQNPRSRKDEIQAALTKWLLDSGNGFHVIGNRIEPLVVPTKLPVHGTIKVTPPPLSGPPKEQKPLAIRKRGTIVTLDQKQNHALTSLILAEYASSGKSDAEFAEYAIEKLSIAELNRSHISNRRKVFDVPNNMEKLVEKAGASLPDRIAALERDVAMLKAKLSDLLK